MTFDHFQKLQSYQNDNAHFYSSISLKSYIGVVQKLKAQHHPDPVSTISSCLIFTPTASTGL